MSIETGVTTAAFRAEFRNRNRRYTLRSFPRAIEDLESLLFYASLIVNDEFQVDHHFGIRDEQQFIDTLWRREVSWGINTREITVLRVSYKSPLEVVFSVVASTSAVATGAYVAASRCITLFEKYQQARLTHARADKERAQADVAQIETLNFMAAQLDLRSADVMLANSGREKRQHARDQRSRQAQARIRRAAKALESLSKYEKLDGHDD